MKLFTIRGVIAAFSMTFIFLADTVPEEAPFEQKAKNIAAALSDSELAGQVIMTGVDAAAATGISGEEAARLSRIKPGAIMLFRKNLTTDDAAVRSMNKKIADAAALADAAPFIAVDQEGGAVERVKNASARLPSPAYYGELRQTQGETAALNAILRDAERSARHLFNIGITLNLAPIAEPLNNENKKFLKDRAYGDAAWTAKAAAAFIQGMESGGVACVIKHFPGNSDIDPHRAMPILRGSAAELDAHTEPFRVIAGSAAGIMAAHSIAAAWDAERGASLSPIIIQKKIKDSMSFAGFVLADDFSMGAAAGSLDTSKAAVASLAAGADMVMAWPANLDTTHRAILKSLKTGVLTRERLRDAAGRILYSKLRKR